MTTPLSANEALAIVNHCPFPLLVLDPQDRVIGYYGAFEQLVGGAQAAGLQDDEFATLSDHPLRTLLSNASSVCWTDSEEKKHYFEVHQIDLPGESRTQARFFVDIRKQVELEQANGTLNDRLKQPILTESDTGLLNQRGVMLALEPQVARSRRYNTPISVIMMDVHCSGGHQSTLLHIARLLKDQLRWADLAGCTENREFMLVLPETSTQAALKLADKLTQRLQVLAREKLDGQHLATNYGVTAWRRNDNATSLLKRAAMALSQSRAEHSKQSIAL
jgi:diguanylate cyclase (GGDEF)-like protein